MSVTISNEFAEAALRAAAKAGYTDLIKGLVDAGVDPAAFYGSALLVAERYGQLEAANLLRQLIEEKKTGKAVSIGEPGPG